MGIKSLVKRGHSRYPIDGKFEGSELAGFHGQKGAVTFRGQVKNISDGGFCLFATHAPRESVLLQGQLKLARFPAQIPMLVQVRWVDRPPRSRHYRIGLQYVI
jgi:hypothetical protein